MNFVMINGELLGEDKAVLPALSREVQLGISAFETMLSNNGKIDGLDLHIQRLKDGCDRLACSECEAAIKPDILLQQIEAVLTANHLDSTAARVRITVIAGKLLVQASALDEVKESCSVIISDHVLNERRATAGIKCGSYADNILALREAQSEGADEVIFLNSLGEVAEAAMANVFLVNDGVLITPRLASGCLPGITRRLVIERAREAGIEVLECVVLLDDLMDADEVFLTNSVGGVRAVERIGDVEITQGMGEVTKRVRDCYRNGC